MFQLSINQKIFEFVPIRLVQIEHILNIKMEVLIFGSFVVLAFVALAFHFISRQSDDQKKSVSNVNFVSFQRSFFVVYFMALFGDWLQGPYVYKLYSYYGYPESQVK